MSTFFAKTTLDSKFSQGEHRLSIKYSAVLPAGDSRRFVGEVQLLSPKGISVISDIDVSIYIHWLCCFMSSYLFCA